MTGNQNTERRKRYFDSRVRRLRRHARRRLVAVAISLTEPTRIAVPGRGRSVLGQRFVGIVLARRVRELPIRLGRNCFDGLPFPSGDIYSASLSALRLGWLGVPSHRRGVCRRRWRIAGYVVMWLAEAAM